MARIRHLAPGALLLAALSTATATAAVPSTDVTGGTTTIVLGGVAARQLDEAGVRVAPAGRATRRSGGVRLRIVAGRLGETSRIEHARRDGLTLRRGARRASLTDLTLRLGTKPTLRARIGGGPARIVARARRGRLAIAADGSTGRRSRITWVLTKTAAAELRSRLRIDRLAAAGLLRTAVAATGTPVTPAPATPPAATTGDSRVATGTADWGVRASFRRYIAGPIASGTIGVSDGAIRTEDGFRFVEGAGTIDRATGAVDVRFRGTVAFDGHQGALQVRLSNPRIVAAAGATTGELHVDATSKDRDSGEVKSYPDLVVATLDLTKGSRSSTKTTVTWSKVPAPLTESGVPAFGGFYEAGSELDPVGFTVVAG